MKCGPPFYNVFIIVHLSAVRHPVLLITCTICIQLVTLSCYVPGSWGLALEAPSRHSLHFPGQEPSTCNNHSFMYHPIYLHSIFEMSYKVCDFLSQHASLHWLDPSC